MLLFLYIDPGTGSMLFSILIGIVSTLIFFGQRLFMKVKFMINGGKIDKINNAKIPYIIFSDHKRYWNVFKPVCDEFEKRGLDLVYWTASPDDPALNEKYEHVKTEFIGEGNKAFARLNMMNAGICLSTTPGLEVYQWKRSRNVDCYVHIRHDVEEPVGYRMFGCDFYDAILLTGSHQEAYIRKFEELRGEAPKECVITGSPYLDTMKKRLDALKKASDNVDASKKKTILLAPTWGASGILSKYGEEIIPALISTGYNIIIRPHPQSYTAEKEMLEKLMSSFPETENLHWNRDNDNFDVLSKTDIMITDFSGIIFDFTLIFDKPLIYADTSYNSAPYDSAWIKEPLWRFETLKKIGKKLEPTDFTNMKGIIDSVISNDAYAKERNAVRNEAWHYQMHGAEKTVDYLIQKNEELHRS